MKTPRIIIALTLLAAPLLHAQAPHDPIGGNLFPPDFIMGNADAIHFTDEQRQALRDIVEEAQPRFAGLHEALQQETDALGKLLAQSKPDEAAVLAQFDKVHAREHDAKRAQIALMLRLRGKLTDDQRAKLTEMRAKNMPSQPQPPSPAFIAKVERIKAGIERWQNAGRDPSEIGQFMQQFGPLMQSGKMDEANAVLDQALKTLESDGK